MTRAGRRARWILVPALTLAFAVAGASAAGPGGWDHLGEFETPKVAPLNGAVYALSAESDNGLLVGGNFNFTTAGGRPAAHLAVWYPTGFWTAYATPTPLNGDVHAIAWDADHVKLYVGGNFTDAGGNPTRTSSRSGTAPPGRRSARPRSRRTSTRSRSSARRSTSAAPSQHGAGIATADYLLACDLNTGAARSTVTDDGDINGGVYALTADDTGTLYAGGQFINMAGIPQADHVAAYDGSWHAMGSGPSTGGGAVDDYVRSIASNGTDVYIGTDSVDVAGIAQADHVAKWNGSAWSALGANSAGTDGWLPKTAFIYAIAAKGSEVVATGSFQNADGTHGRQHRRLRRHLLEARSARTAPATAPGSATAWPSRSSARTIYAGGNFTSAGGDPLATYIARFTPQAAPSNAFTIGAAKADLGRGTVTLTANTPGSGTLTLSGPGVRRVRVTTPSGAAAVGLTVRATGESLQALERRGRVSVTVKLTFVPTGGTARSHSTTVVLRKKG